MSEAIRPIELPESRSYGELMKSFFTLWRSLGDELADVASSTLDLIRGPRWFDDLVARRKAQKAPPFQGWRQDPRDLSIILGDYAREHDSPYRQVLTGTAASTAAAKKLQSTRNIWVHATEDPTAGDLRDFVKLVIEFGKLEGLAIAGRAVPLGKRLERLITGQYQGARSIPTVSETRADAPPAPPAPPETEAPLAAPPPRPRIGGLWIGDIPAERYTRTRFGDVVDATGNSIAARVTGDATERFRAWFAAHPLDNRVWIAEDGAVGGYVSGDARLLGWTSADPEDEWARGFYTPHWYEVVDGRVVDIDSMATRELPGVAIPDGTILRVTTYGDLIAIDDSGNGRVAVVSPATWFPGHLG